MTKKKFEPLSKFEKLFLCLIAEFTVLVIGIELFNPFPYSELSSRDNDVMVVSTLLLYVFTCICGFMAAKNKTIRQVLCFLCVFYALIPYVWPFMLGIIIVYTFYMMAKHRKDPSPSVLWGGFFLVNKKNNNIRNQ